MRHILINNYTKLFVQAFALMLGFSYSLNISAQNIDTHTDFDGDGRTDYSIVRSEFTGLRGNPSARAIRSLNEMQNNPGFKPLLPAPGNNFGPSPGTDLGWYINNSQDNSVTIVGFGDPFTDFLVPEDFDGDGQDDIAVWRGVSDNQPNGNAFFFALNSSDNTVSTVDFGQLGDNPTVVGDYDGDNKADPAVFRCPPVNADQCFFYYRGSNNNPNGNITYVPWGNGVVDRTNPFNTTMRPYPGDFDADGKNDFCIYRTSPDNSSQGQYVLLKSSDGGVDYINWGIPFEPLLSPGDYDGDGATDFMNVRIEGTDVIWWMLKRDGGFSMTQWGKIISGFSEFPAPGDYDGDGATDISVWRRDNNDDDNTFFYTLRSSDGTLEAFEWGSKRDVPVAGYNRN